jgi:hypothetical protein
MPPHSSIHQPLSKLLEAKALHAILASSQVQVQALSELSEPTFGRLTGFGSVSSESATDANATVQVFLVTASKDTWSRAARRRQRQTNKDQPMAVDQSDSTLENIFRVTLESSGKDLRFQFIKGRGRELFESFCSHVSRKALAAVKGSSS